MKKFIDHLRTFFSRKRVGIFCLIISIAAINGLQQAIPNMGWDNSFSIAAAKNFSEGHGFSIRQASTGDLSKSYYEPLIKWPPGYSILLVTIHGLGLTDWIRTAFLLNAIGLTLLILLLKKMLLQLEYPLWIINPAILYFGFIYHVFLGIYFTDIFAILFFMAGVSCLLQYVKNEETNIYLIILAAFLFAFSAWQKYLYFGLAFIPFVSLFLYGRKIASNKLQFASVIGSCVTGILIASLIYFQFRNAGHALYIKPSSSTGFFPLQLVGLAPVIPETFLNLDFVNMQVSIHTSITYENMSLIWSVINMICLLLLIRAGWTIIKNPFQFRRKFLDFYLGMGLWISVFIFVFLGALTIHYNKSYPDMMYSWVFVGIPRYFAPFCFLIFQFFIFLYIKPELFPGKTSFYLFRVLMVCIALEEVSHGTYFIIKQIFIKKEFGLQRPADKQELISFQMVKEVLANSTAYVLSAGIPEISNFDGLSGISSVMDLSVFQKPIQSSKDILVISTLDTFTARSMPKAFFKMNTRLITQSDGYSYYLTKINANMECIRKKK